MMSALAQRVVTALILAAGLLFVLFGLDLQGVALVLAGVFAIAAYEWSGLAGWLSIPSRILYVSFIAVVICSLGFVLGAPDFKAGPSVAPVLSFGVAWWLLTLPLVLGYPRFSNVWGSRFGTSLIGLLVLVPSGLGVLWLRAQNDGIALVLYLIAIVASADIGAFFAGRRFGRRKLAPRVSPGKSWEGFVGGLIACSCLAIAASYHFTSIPLPAFVVLTLLAALASVLGDLGESMVKRHRGVKDSGQLLPGHGGVLDRIDSLTAAAPVFALGYLLLGGV